jgi:hypothetical protein
LVGLCHRLLRHTIADEDPATNFYVNFVDLDFRTTNAIIAVTALGLCLCYIGVMPRQRLRTARSDAIEYAMLLLLILLFSPYTFIYFYVWLLYPYTAIVCLWLDAPKYSRDARLLQAVLISAAALASLSLICKREAEAYGNHFLACLLLFGALGWQLNKCKRPAAATLAQPSRLAA